MKKSAYHRFSSMSEARRRKEVARFDREDLKPGRPLSASQRRQWESAKKRGRPQKPSDQRAARVLITLPPDLLRAADAYAKAHGISRAALVAIGLRQAMGSAKRSTGTRVA